MVAPGQILGGKYQVERIIGTGGMGLVVAAKHLHLDQRVAVKLLGPEHVGNPAIVDRFVREARASVRLRSEHVARVLDAGRFEDGAPYLVMEYLEGRDLAAELAEVRCLPVVVAVDCMLQVCEAVAEAHQVGIVHRDLKPANIFVTRDADGAPLLKVLDFGISKLADDVSELTSTKMVLGSPPYMSPEQLRASRSVDVRSDIWSLGVVLYELVSGRRPFVADTLTALALKITSDPPDPLAPDGSAALEVVIQRCFAKPVAERYPTVAEFAGALAPFAGPGGHDRIERIRRRLAAAGTQPGASGSLAIPSSGVIAALAATPSGAGVVSGVDERTTLSSATGTLSAGDVRSRPRYLLIGGVALVMSAIAVGAAVMFWPARGTPGAAASRPGAVPEPASIAPASTAPASPAPPSTAVVDAAVSAPDGTAAASKGAAPPTSETATQTNGAAASVDGASAGSAATSGSADPSSTALRPRAPARPGEVQTPPKPVPKPPSRRPPRSGPGSAKAPEDLTKSQY